MKQRFLLDRQKLPENYPTHAHNAYFWEHLGRAVATFGFLEEVLTKAIFAFTSMKEFSETEAEEEYRKWTQLLEKTISDPLGGLIEKYGKAIRNNPDTVIENLEELLCDLRNAAKVRNVLCHGSWRQPDQNGASVPFFVNTKQEIFETAIDVDFLKKTRAHVTDLACTIIDSVSFSGWQFPGSTGPGLQIWDKTDSYKNPS